MSGRAGPGHWLLRQMILSAHKGPDKIRLTAIPEPFNFLEFVNSGSLFVSGRQEQPRCWNSAGSRLHALISAQRIKPLLPYLPDIFTVETCLCCAETPGCEPHPTTVFVFQLRPARVTRPAINSKC